MVWRQGRAALLPGAHSGCHCLVYDCPERPASLEGIFLGRVSSGGGGDVTQVEL